MSELDKLFFPRAVGIIGVNNKPFGGGQFLLNLQTMEFDKPIYIFNPRLKGQEVRGLKVYGSILEIPDGEIDYVILAVPAKLCASILEEIGKKKVPFVTIFTSGFSEVGNDHLEKDVLEVAKKYNIRINGPNCMGIYNPKSRLSISFGQTTDSGNFGIIGQSGGLAITLSIMAIHTYGTYISKLVSIGNQIDLNVVDYLEYFSTDDETKEIGIYLENIKSQKIGKDFINIVRKLSFEKRKPVILWKAGYGDSAKEAILSHTGGLAGSSKIWNSIAKQTGAILVNSSVELVSLAMLFNYLDIHQASRNLGIITVGGGSSIETTDLMEMYNLSVPALNESTKEKFRDFIPDVNTILNNPLDLGAVGLDPKILSKTILLLDKEPNISIVVIIQFIYNNSSISEIIKIKSKMKKPLICIAPRMGDSVRTYRSKLKFKEELFQNGIPTYESTELAAKALDRVCTYKESLEKRNLL